MIENLNGTHETVNFKETSHLRLYDNKETEDFPKHWHIPIEIIMPTIGVYYLDLDDRQITIEENEIAIIGSCVIHAIRAPEEYIGQRVIFQADLSFFQSIKELTAVLGLISPVMIISPSTAPNIYQQVRDLLFSISKDYNEANSLYEATIYMKLLEMFILIGRDYINYEERFINSKFQKQQEYADKFIFICNYITDHCTEDLSLDKVARIAGFSKYHFSRLFKQFTNETFYKYLNQRRIEYAEQLLANSKFSVTEVALQAGFPSLSAFIRMFKLAKQCTPTEFRSMHMQNLDIPPASYENIITE